MPQFQRVDAVADLDGLACLAAERLTVGGGRGTVQEVGAVRKPLSTCTARAGYGRDFQFSKSALGKDSGTNRPLLGAKPRTIASDEETRSAESLVL